ncbi:hypothetical protein [Mycetocola miduiensis]|nr:hypothetical protein [Mycetocola miduiensis]
MTAAETVVLEDANSGVAAAVNGGYGWVSASAGMVWIKTCWRPAPT